MSFLINQHVTAGTKLNSFLSKSSAWFKCYAATFRCNLNSSLSNEHQFLQHGFHDQNTLHWNLYRRTRTSFELHEFVYSEMGQPAVGKYVVISTEVNHSLVLPKTIITSHPCESPPNPVISAVLTEDRSKVRFNPSFQNNAVWWTLCSRITFASGPREKSIFCLRIKAFLTCVITEGNWERGQIFAAAHLPTFTWCFATRSGGRGETCRTGQKTTRRDKVALVFHCKIAHFIWILLNLWFLTR